MTIRISPFAGDADICPLDAPWDSGYLAPAPQHIEDVIGSISFFHNNMRVNISNIRRLICMVWPMESDELASLACQGYEDARRFLITRGQTLAYQRFYRYTLRIQKITLFGGDRLLFVQGIWKTVS